jgi:UDP-glucose 4-epimerase
MTVLVTGGAGYIGSVTVDRLIELGHKVIVLDNLSRGHKAAVSEYAEFFRGDISDANLVKQLIDKFAIDSVIHFAAFAYVGESVRQPLLYYQNNVVETISLLETVVGAGVRNFVFSSTCATYGEPQIIPINEGHPQNPTNPYGKSKLYIENALRDIAAVSPLRYVSLRYFNAAGATETRGEDHRPETHLIPLAIFSALGRIGFIEIFGTDYDTPDGTAVRDYIHVKDLADAHISALGYLSANDQSVCLNLGTGKGYSVREIISVVKQISGKDFYVKESPRRPGDPSKLVADPTLAESVLNWKASSSSIEEIISDALNWHIKTPEGYPSD